MAVTYMSAAAGILLLLSSFSSLVAAENELARGWGDGIDWKGRLSESYPFYSIHMCVFVSLHAFIRSDYMPTVGAKPCPFGVV